MIYDPEKHHRHSIRLKGWDYAQTGAYFVTIVCQDRACLFGDVVDCAIRLNDAGRIVQATWDGLPDHYANVGLDAFVIMPNHIHGIIVLNEQPVGAGLKPARGSKPAPDFEPARGFQPAQPARAGFKPAPTIVDAASRKRHGLPEIIRGFKTFSARCINVSRNTAGRPVWQRNYYEHIICDEESLNRIRRYIADNPGRWAFDRENPFAITPEPADARSDDI